MSQAVGGHDVVPVSGNLNLVGAHCLTRQQVGRSSFQEGSRAVRMKSERQGSAEVVHLFDTPHVDLFANQENWRITFLGDQILRG